MCMLAWNSQRTSKEPKNVEQTRKTAHGEEVATEGLVKQANAEDQFTSILHACNNYAQVCMYALHVWVTNN